MLDHALAVVFAIGFPVVAGPTYLRRKSAMLEGVRAVRRREYIETIWWLSAMGVSSLVVWAWSGRDAAMLGLGFDLSWRLAASLGIALAMGVILSLQVHGVRRDPTTKVAAQEALGSVREYFPTSTEEMALFRGVSVAAGIGEEIFYRGFLLWYLGGFMSVPWAVVLSSALFGIAHYMHGTQASARATLMGFVLAGLYLLSGSLWASMLLHTVVDLSSGELGAAAFADSPVAT